jgi:ubiquinone/menaquinone biosynthesis C-methylase UbiE
MKIALDPLASFYRKEFEFIQERGDSILIQGIGERLPFFSKIFDCVVSDNVIDHTANAKEVLSEIFRVLKDDGVFLLAVNLHHWIYSLFSFAFKVLFFFNIILNFPNFRTHTYFFTPSRMKRMIKSEGFKILFEEIPLQRDLSNRPTWGFNLFRPFNHVSGIFVCSKGHLN